MKTPTETARQRLPAAAATATPVTAITTTPLRPRAIPFAALLAGKTFAKIVLRRQPGLLGAWSWNWWHLGQTLAARRELLRARRGDPATLERRIAAHARRQRAERAARRRSA